MTTIDFNEALKDKRFLWDTQNSEMSPRTANALYNERIRYVIEVVANSEAELLMLPNFGHKQLNELRAIIEPMGLSFGTEFTNVPEAHDERRKAISAARAKFGDDIDLPITVEAPINLARRAAEEILSNAGFDRKEYEEKDPRRAIRLLAEAILACDRSGLDTGDVFKRLSTSPTTPAQVLSALQVLKK